MMQVSKLVFSLALCAIARGAQAQAPVQLPAPIEWSSMSRAKVAKPLDAAGPMASDLSSVAAAPKWADVPLPPPPGARQAGAKAPAAQGAVAPLGTSGAAASGMGAAGLLAQSSSAPPPSQGAAGEPQVKTAVDQTGAMISVRQDLDSDRIRQDWAATGGTIPAFEANGGMTILYKDMSQQIGAGAYMSGVGFNFGGRITMLMLDPPKYETRDRDWTAWKVGGGIDLGVLSSTFNLPATRYTSAMTTRSSVSTMTLVGTIGFMHAFGSFDSPTEWSGFAIGADWAPSYQSMSMTDSTSGQVTTSSSFNATGFAINFESGSMRSMAAKMGKKAHMKLSLFFLPPTGQLPFLMTASLGAVWY